MAVGLGGGATDGDELVEVEVDDGDLWERRGVRSRFGSFSSSIFGSSVVATTQTPPVVSATLEVPGGAATAALPRVATATPLLGFMIFTSSKPTLGIPQRTVPELSNVDDDEAVDSVLSFLRNSRN